MLSPPFAGSTLLTELISTSPDASVNNTQGVMEGMKIPGLVSLYGNFEERWNPEYTYSWGLLEQAWRKHWDVSKKVLIEKSPPLIIRSKQLITAFPKARYMILVRDPYAHIESLMRRRNWSIKQATAFSLMCLKAQYDNVKLLRSSALLIRYEDLTDEPQKIKKEILNHLPELGDINIEKLFKAHNFVDQELAITNLNEQKIALFSQEQLMEIQSLLAGDIQLLEFFGYRIIT